MKPTTYATLATAVQDYLSRTDVGVASGNLDYLITEAEQEMNARLRVRRMLTTVTPTVSAAGVVTLPSDYGGWKRFQARDGTSEWDLDLVAAEQLTSLSPLYGGSNGTPEAIVTLGSTSQVWPFTNGSYTYAALYYARIPNLTSSATTNWVITNFPMAYVFGCLTAARGFVKDQNPQSASRFDMWAKRFDRVIEQIQDEDKFDLDARSSATLVANTSLFGGSSQSNIKTDS